jgi:Fe-S-cluster containining protein
MNYDLKVCGYCCPKFIVSTLMNHRDRENKERGPQRTYVVLHILLGHMLVILEKSSGFGCRTTTAGAEGKTNSQHDQGITAGLD